MSILSPDGPITLHLAGGTQRHDRFEEQAQGESPEHHEMKARQYAEAKGWDVVRVYDLSAVSGKIVMEHPRPELRNRRRA